MQYALVALAAFQAVALLWALTNKDKLFDSERAAWTKERCELLLRIQAPQVAVMEQQIEKAGPSFPAVGLEDDQGYWESKEAFADRLMAEETA